MQVSELSLFVKDKWKIRKGADEDGTEWVVAVDVCAVLDVDRTQIRRVPEAMKGMRSVHTPGGIQETTVLFEAGVYKLAFTSRKPEAEAFTDWVASTVLPAIHKTGAYAVKPATQLEALLQAVQGMVVLEQRQAVLETSVRSIKEAVALQPHVQRGCAEVRQVVPRTAQRVL
jgi:prophage antirepressor-like protein